MGWIVLAVVVVLVLFCVTAYNGLVMTRNDYRNAFAQIDVQLTRRYELIPNLVETAKGYMRHERETLEAVIAARGGAVSGLQAAKAAPGEAAAMQQLSGADAALSQSLGRLLALSEAYPELKADRNMLQLSAELSATENRLSSARQAYNDAVTGYNNRREVFPNSLVANLFAFVPAQPLQLENAAMRAAPNISFQ